MARSKYGIFCLSEVSIPTNSFGKLTTDKKKNERLKEILISRRIAIGLYSYLLKNSNGKLEKENIAHYVKYILINSTKCNNIDNTAFDFKDLIKGIIKDKRYNHVSTYLAVKLEDRTWPLGLLPEEYAWLTKDGRLDPNAMIVVEKYYSCLQEVTILFQNLIDSNPFFSKILIPNKPILTKRKPSIGTVPVLLPMIGNVDQIKGFIDLIKRDILQEINDESEGIFKLFITFLKNFESWASDKPPYFIH
ncbi:MAG: hypothetical protein IPL20_03265 [Saprospiraceae bacterium]|nr:hypothetical protein [Saprospiraceae bacterium]